MTRRTGIILALAAAVSVLGLAACSGGDSAPTTAAVEPAAPAPATAVVEPEEPKISALEEALQHGLEITGPTGHDEDQAPEFTGLTRWLNSPPLTMTELQGEVVLVDFWTYT